MVSNLKMHFSWSQINLTRKQEQFLMGIAVGILLILSIFTLKPFGIRFKGGDTGFRLLLLAYALATSAVLLCNEMLVKNILLPKFRFRKWSGSSVFLWYFYQMASVLIVCFLIFSLNSYSSRLPADLTVFMIGLRMVAFLLAPLMILVSFTIRKLFPLDDLITLKSSDKSSDFQILPAELFFIECQDNYAAIYYTEGDDNHLRKKLIRSTMSALEEQLSNADIRKCHRSFIVNPLHIQAVKGNKKQMRLVLKNTDRIIPVSRKHSDFFEKLRK
ncbi:hypothetical protein GWK08_06155 [Leptobacterium flavescens]|uniref:HTH LytTR-type domain-containing protein n=1 Tax=Leptobacterium flavescens TaxID=472055 RepID=A0A6P0UQ47_9FLAO|nr:LytTR family DNA-binding domain-containing protein [Leptobacterium flavescens]NER13013.1 hypothetical protein [Leptobacterium flavescens]